MIVPRRTFETTRIHSKRAGSSAVTHTRPSTVHREALNIHIKSGVFFNCIRPISLAFASFSWQTFWSVDNKILPLLDILHDSTAAAAAAASAMMEIPEASESKGLHPATRSKRLLRLLSRSPVRRRRTARKNRCAETGRPSCTSPSRSPSLPASRARFPAEKASGR